jgi:hypothetical protein
MRIRDILSDFTERTRNADSRRIIGLPPLTPASALPECTRKRPEGPAP